MSMNARVTLRIEPGRVSRLLRLPGGLVERDIRRRTERVAAAARREAPGSMKDGIRSGMSRRGREASGFVTSTHPATIYVISGTRPHVIRPVRAAALRFTVGGRVVFAKVVHHPGTQANDFLTRALRAAR